MSDYGTNPDLKGWISADEVQEPKALEGEIDKLREENRALREKIDSLQSAAKRDPDATSDDELFNVLKAIEVKIPAALADGKDVTSDLLSVAYGNRDTLINRVTNGYGVSEVETFFYYNIIPKLQAHGLADNEKVPGVRYRRGFLNRRGQRFFASLEKQQLLSKSKQSTQSPSPEQSSIESELKQKKTTSPGKAQSTKKTEKPAESC
jgi:hypothetical protein